MTCTRCFHHIQKNRLGRTCTVAGAQGSKTERCGCFHGSAVLAESKAAMDKNRV